MVTNLNILLDIMRDDYGLEVNELDIKADALTEDYSTVNRLCWMLFESFILHRVRHDKELGEVCNVIFKLNKRRHC
jgi:hypothetical protein